MLCSIPHAKIDKRPTIINFFQIIKKRGFRLDSGTLLLIEILFLYYSVLPLMLTI